METDQHNILTNVRLDLSEIKGTLNTIVTVHAEQIRNQGEQIKQLRIDLTSVKDEAAREMNSVLSIANRNSENIKDIREDVKTINDRQNAATGKVFQIVSPVAAVGALIWSFIVGSR